MTSDEEKLLKLRGEIDTIDNAIHDLIMRRTRVIEGVCEIKKDSTVKIRPSREASILYRLCEKHTGHFPKRELCRIWRELIVATLSFEGPFSVAVFDPGDTPGYWDLARDQYGTFTPMQRHKSARAVVEEVRKLQATVGVLPFPSHDQADSWWKFLVSEAPETPKVIARLPFIPNSNTHDKDLDALVICPVSQEKTGRDRSFLAIESAEEIGSMAMERALSKVQISNISQQVWHDPNRPPGWTYLVEILGFIQPSDENLSRLKEELGTRVARIIGLGGYSTPLDKLDLVEGKIPEEARKRK
ncbi:MAG: chorismate mutase [Magnetovibrio sp.]|nr:chorismate mutase [Magnetovibrio sp.]